MSSELLKSNVCDPVALATRIWARARVLLRAAIETGVERGCDQAVLLHSDAAQRIAVSKWVALYASAAAPLHADKRLPPLSCIAAACAYMALQSHASDCGIAFSNALRMTMDDLAMCMGSKAHAARRRVVMRYARDIQRASALAAQKRADLVDWEHCPAYRHLDAPLCH